MWNARLDEAQARISIAGKNINKLRYADDTTLMAQSEEELKSLLKKATQYWRRLLSIEEGKRGEWKSWLKAEHSEN